MAKFFVSEEMKIKVVDHGRSKIKVNEHSYSSELVRFDGEQCVIVTYSGMQSGKTDLMIILWNVDSFLKVAFSKTVKSQFANAILKEQLEKVFED